MNNDYGDQKVSSSNSSMEGPELSGQSISPEDMAWVLNEEQKMNPNVSKVKNNKHPDDSECLTEEENEIVHQLRAPLNR